MKTYDRYTDPNSPSGMTENPSTSQLPGRRTAKGTTSRRRGWAAWARTALPPLIQVPFTKQRPPPKAAQGPQASLVTAQDARHGGSKGRPAGSPRPDWDLRHVRARDPRPRRPRALVRKLSPRRGKCELQPEAELGCASGCSPEPRGLIRPKPRAHQQQRAEQRVRGQFSRARGSQRCQELPRTCFSPHSPIRQVLS